MEKKVIYVKATREFYDKLDTLAKSKGLNISNYIRLVITELYDKYKEERK